MDLNNRDGNIDIVNNNNSVTFNLNDHVNVAGSVGANEDGKGVTLKSDGTIMINGADTIKGSGTNGTMTLAQTQGTLGELDAQGNDQGKTTARIVYQSVDPTSGENIVREVATMDDGLVFAGDFGDNSKRHLGSKVTVKGGETDNAKLSDAPNIGVESDGMGSLTVKLAKSIDLSKDGSLTVGNTTMNDGGVHITQGPSITQDGINVNNKTISNVADGVNEGDAVNVKQLKASQSEVADGTNTVVTKSKGANGQDIYHVHTAGDLTNIRSISNGDTTVTLGQDEQGNSVVDVGGSRVTNVAPGKADSDAVNVAQLKGVAGNFAQRLNKVDRDLRAGIAGSNAAASLPQVRGNGKSMVAVAAGTYRGENAVAVGFSKASDNGKLLLKLQGNANSRGDVGGGVGLGYEW